jgi:hypothetical protein
MKKQSFNDNWTCNDQPVTLPHDATIHQERKPDSPSGSAQAYFPGRKHVYEKHFRKPEAEHVLLEFEGVYRNAKVFINEKQAGGAAYGYIPFFVDADDYLVDGENVIRVECENIDQPDSRWYTGAGIYRPVWMWTGDGETIVPESVHISTLSVDPAVIRVQSNTDVHISIQYEGREVASGDGSDIELTIPGAKLWSDETPNLYTCAASTATDEYRFTFGIRQVTRDREGLKVNDRKVLLRGGCVHQDSGIVGAATYDELEWRRVRLLKEAGFNAIRAAHNPANRALLDACDALGVYVMDEGWDMWYNHKSKHDYAGQWRESWKSDLAAMVSRDFNHPSVILYSIGNEVSEPAKPEGVQAAKDMMDFLQAQDANRLVTAGFNLMIIKSAAKGKGVYKEDGSGRDDSSDKKVSGMNSTMFNLITNIVGTGMNRAANGKAADLATSPALDLLDVAGYNYASGRYPKEGQLHPDRLVVGSETFPQDIVKNWRMVEKYPWLCGDFMWTAWDYLGEVGLGAWAYTPDGKGFNKPYPWLLADSGAMDILGNPNGELFLAQAVWHTGKPVRIAVQPVNHPGVKPAKAVWRGTNAIPSWSWKGCEGYPAVVEVYADADYVELSLNGKTIGRKKIKDCKAAFKLKYAPGKLTAVAYDEHDQPVGDDELISATGEINPVITCEKQTVKPGEVFCADISLRDGKGTIESSTDEKLTVTVEGGKLLGFGSANPRTEERFDSGSYTTYYGRAMAVIRAGDAGSVTMKVGGGKEILIPIQK